MWRIAATLLIIFTLVFSQAWAQNANQEEGQIHVKSNTLTYEQQNNVVTATGNAVATKGDTTITADSISVNRTTNEMSASGNVEVKDLRGVIKGDTLRMEMENETGDVTNGTITLPREQYILTGKTLQKSYGQTYHIEDGAFTTCYCDNFAKADWSVGGKTIDVTRGGSGVVHDGTFRVRGIPLIYFPYLSVAVSKERQSGFLFPHYGFSNTRGFVWQQPFYWAINKSYDATITTDLETNARVGLWGEFRYAPNEQTEGLLAASYFNQQIGGPATTDAPVNRWSVSGVHRQLLPDDLRLYSDLLFVSDNAFLREISHRALGITEALDTTDYEIRTRRFTDSRLGLVKTWDNALLRGEDTYYRDLINPQNSAFQVLPHLQFQGQRYFWQNRLEAGISVDGANFYRDQGYYGPRLDLAPSLALPFHLGEYVFGSVKAVGHETLYHLTSEAVGNPPLPGPGQLNGDRTREIVQLQADLGTRLSRVFDLHWGRLAQLQHVVEPHISYLYTPFVGQQDLPLYDSLDRINKRDLLVYGVDNRLLGKFAPLGVDPTAPGTTPTEVRELASFSLLHAYDPVNTISGPGDHFSNVDVNGRLTPLPYTTFTIDSSYAAKKGDVSSTGIGMFVSDPRPLPPTTPLLEGLQRHTTLGVSYRNVSNRTLKEINAYVLLRLNEAITGAYMARYDFNTGAFVGDRFYLRFLAPQKCWYIDLAAIDKVNPHEFEFRVFFTLVGLSSTNERARF